MPTPGAVCTERYDMGHREEAGGCRMGRRMLMEGGMGRVVALGSEERGRGNVCSSVVSRYIYLSSPSNYEFPLKIIYNL